MDSSVIIWPDGPNYKKYPVRSFNQLFIPASAEIIWAWLITAAKWPEWYKNSRKVKIVGGGKILKAGSKFTWETFHVKVNSQVLVFRPYTDLGWSAREWGAGGFHGWKVIPGSGGCLVVTEEVQGGLMTRLLKNRIRKALHTQHQIWLEGLSRMAQIGFPKI